MGESGVIVDVPRQAAPETFCNPSADSVKPYQVRPPQQPSFQNPPCQAASAGRHLRLEGARSEGIHLPEVGSRGSLLESFLCLQGRVPAVLVSVYEEATLQLSWLGKGLRQESHIACCWVLLENRRIKSSNVSIALWTSNLGGLGGRRST